MRSKLYPHPYHRSLQKCLLDIGLSGLGLVILAPLFACFAILILLASKGPVFFTQKRVGKKGRTFVFIKFRTMGVRAEHQQKYLRHLNEADGPAFKIKNDPRYVGIGRFLAKTGLDELPQLLNVIKGEMSLVGPRPFPVAEAKKLTKAQKVRELIKPGITSSWVVSGSHDLSFKEWMRLDKEYLLNASFRKDFEILSKTGLMITQLVLNRLTRLFK